MRQQTPRLMVARLTASVACPHAAGARMAVKRRVVNADASRTDFCEVFRISGAGSSNCWCAVGDDIDRIPNMPANTRINGLCPVGLNQCRPERPGVTFRPMKDPEVAKAAARGLGMSRNIRQVGDTLRVSHARSGGSNSVERNRVRGVMGGF